MSDKRKDPASADPESKRVFPTRTGILVSTGLIAAGGAAWVLWNGLTQADEGVPVPEAFAVESIRQKMDKPQETKRLFASRKYDELTDEQRRQVHQNKEQAVRQMWQGAVSDDAPASLLRMHPRVTLYLDADSAALLDAKPEPQ